MDLIEIEAPWYEQPPAPTEAARGIELTRGLRVLHTPTARVNLATGAQPTTYTAPLGRGPRGVALTNNATFANYAGFAGLANAAGPITILFLGSRDATATTSGVATVQNVVHTMTSVSGNRWEFNLGNGFGPLGDIDKPRWTDQNGNGIGLEMMIDGQLQSGVNPAPTALVNGRPYTIICSADQVHGGGREIRLLGGTDLSGQFAANATCYLVAIWDRKLTFAEQVEVSRNPWQLIASDELQFFLEAEAAGGAADLVVSDSVHSHSADSLTLTTSSTLAIQDATHAHTADALSLTTLSALTVADATHAHAADNVTLSATGSASLSIADALHSHTAGGLTLTTESALAIADALHAHAADGLTLETGTSLLIAEALHAHTADGLDLTVDAFLVVADATHGHTVDALVLTLPGTGADPAAVWSYVLSNGKTAEQNLVENNAMLAIVTAILRNKRITDPVAGTQTIYADDGISVLLQGGLFEDAAGTQPYRGQGADRAERLT